jgi:O-methyltransferase
MEISKMKKSIAKNGKRLMESLVFKARKALVEPRLDSRRDSLLISWATYSPWLLDEGFLACHRLIKDYTLVDLYRCYELWHLLGQVQGLDGDILEVGAWRGGTGGLLGRRSQDLGLDATVYLCDTFEGVVKTGSSDKSYDGGEHADTSVPVVEELIQKLEISNIEILTGIFPEDTAHSIADRKFRFCHIDVDVYQSGKDVLDWVWERLPVGGIVVFDDFGFASTTGITKLVHEKEKNAGLVCVQNINGHAVFVKTSS